MPFGAEYDAEGTRFRLWAPACEQLRCAVSGKRYDMRPLDGGWHELVLPVAPGARYLFVLPDGTEVPDPASRSNPQDVSGPSAVVDPLRYEWKDGAWRGRPWREAVVYELHVGTFTVEGTFAAAAGKLDYLAGVGFTAIELMPVADFAGTRNWGYDGVLPFAPDSAYGTPEDLKAFVDAAHARGLMVLLDVVYNHFGPEGNFIPKYAPAFFNPAHRTPWGAAVNFDGDGARTVRDFYVHNALYWLEEYRFDGLRLDAVHAMIDESPEHIVSEIARAVGEYPFGREVHLVLENDANSAQLLDRGRTHATAQWNDDWHHSAHLLLTGESQSYYRDYAADPAKHLARALAEGFAYQGERSVHRDKTPRGEPSAHVPLEAFVPFLQNHDQVGNRARGERLADLAKPEALRLATAVLLLAPAVPLVFMGEEMDARTPFLFFCDFHGELAQAVREGRKREFAELVGGAGAVPDPTDERTFLASKLPWETIDSPAARASLARYRRLLELRREHVVPRLAGERRGARFETDGARGIAVDWTFADRSVMHLRANFADAPSPLAPAPGALIHAEGDRARGLGPWSGAWTLEAR